MSEHKKKLANHKRPELHIVEDTVGPEASRTSQNTPVDRAEELIDVWADRLLKLTSKASRGVLKSVSLVKEEVEDVWAEAKAISRTKA